MRSIEPQDPANTYASILDALPIVAFLARPDGSISYLSRRWYELTGIDPADVLGTNYPSFIHPEQRARAVEIWRAARAAEATYRDEMQLRFGDGAYHWVSTEASPMRDPHTKHVVGWLGLVTDIDARKRDDEAFRAQAEFNARLIESSDDCIKTMDLDGRLLSMSENGRKLLGIADIDALIGSSWLDFWTGDDRTAAFAAIATAIGGKTGRFAGYFPVATTPRWFDVAITAVLDAGGRPERLLAVSRDITLLRQSSEALAESLQRLRAITEALPGVTWSASATGELDFVSDTRGDRAGNPRRDVLGKSWLDVVHPDDREAASLRWQEAVTSGEPYETQFRVETPKGDYRWQLVRALPVRNESSGIVRWVGVNIDIDDQHRADEAREAFVALAEKSGDFIGICDPDGTVRYVNQAGRDLVEVGSLEDARQTRLLDFFCPDELDRVENEMLPQLTAQGRWIGDLRFRNFRTGEALPVTYNAFALTDRTGRLSAFATVSHDLRRRKRVEAGLHLLSRTGAAVTSLDLSITLRELARAFVPEFASFCLIDSVSDDAWQRTYFHVDERKAEALNLTPRPRGEHPVALAIERRQSTLRIVDATPLEGFEPERDAVARELDTRSFITVPVVTPDGTTVGALTCGRDGSHESEHFDRDDVTFVREAARRAGSAITNARLYERQRRVAVELQAASLPAMLPRVGQLHISAEYRPGSDEATIGGDWYDAFVLSDGRVAFTVGDVLGHGLHAAITMTKLRQSMQSAAMIDPDPNVMLTVADKTLRLVDPDCYATALAAIYDGAQQTLTFASAGHAGPMVRAADGSIVEYTSPGTMLGLRPDSETDTVVLPAPPGTNIVFSTDGLVEATRDIEIGLARMRDALLHDDVIFDREAARRIVRHVLGPLQATDDIAVLVVQTKLAAQADLGEQRSAYGEREELHDVDRDAAPAGVLPDAAAAEFAPVIPLAACPR